MFNGAVAKNTAEKGEASLVMVGWVAVWQAAKKALSHSPYVTCFPSASAVRICYQPAPAARLSGLNGRVFPPTCPFPSPLPNLSVLSLSRGCYRWRKGRWCMMKAWLALTHINKTPTHSCQLYCHASIYSCSNVSLFFLPAEGYWRYYFFLCLWKALAVMYRTAHSRILSHKHAASWGKADG